MHSIRKTAALIARVVFVLVVVAGALLLLPRQGMDFTNSHAKTQEEGRTVSRKPWRVEPVNVVAARNKKKEKIDIDKAFDDDDDWLDGFTVTVVNNSGKIVTAVTIEMIFRREAGDTRPPVAEAIHFGLSPFGPEYINRDPSKVIKVGDTADLRLIPENYRVMKERLERHGYPKSIRKVELQIREVGFEDGTAFLGGGFWLQDPNNPDDPTKKIPVPEPARPRRAPGMLPNGYSGIERRSTERNTLTSGVGLMT